MTHLRPAHTPFYPNTGTVADNFVIAKDINNGFTPMRYYSVRTVFGREFLCITLFLSISLAREEPFCGVVWSGGVPQSHLFTALYLC